MLGKCQWKSEESAESKEMLSRQSKSALSFHERSWGEARCQRLLLIKIKTALAAVLLCIYEPCSSILGIQCYKSKLDETNL